MESASLPFLDLARHDPQAPALFDDTATAWLSYGELCEKVKVCAQTFTDWTNEEENIQKNGLKSSPLEGEDLGEGEKTGERSSLLHAPSPVINALRRRSLRGEGNPAARALLLCCLPRSIDGVVAYLAAAQAGHAVAMADPQAPNLPSLTASYEPEWIIAPPDLVFDSYEPTPWPLPSLQLLKRTAASPTALHPDFFLMLLTSGSTGSSKGVRLSYANIASNTLAIIKSLSLSSPSNALAHLPLSYSFGLSVLHAQLAIGGRCTLSEESMMSGALWKLTREQQVTLFAGVPYHYEMLMRLGLDRLKVPSLTTFVQAGGKMALPLTQQMLDTAQKRGGELFIMYGQTEAAPRMSCFPLHRHPEKIGTSGVVLDGGAFTVVEDEILYTGPNVMMGYATSRADLAQGDVMNGRMATGDLGHLDADGFLTITGRKERFAKLFGQRIALDDLEKLASPLASCIAVELPEKIVLATLCTQQTLLDRIKETLTAQTKLPAPWFEIRTLPSLPRNANGKIDYPALQKMVGG